MKPRNLRSEREANDELLVFTTNNLHEFRGLLNDYCHICSIRREGDDDVIFAKGIKFVVVELSKFQRKIEDCLEEGDKWCYFLKNSGKLDSAAADKLKEGDKIMGEAVRKLQKLSLDKRKLAEIRSIEKFKLDMAYIEKKRVEAGIAKGKAEGKAEVAANMLAEGVDMETICKCTGLSEEEIEVLK